jgi:hypothetical protein
LPNILATAVTSQEAGIFMREASSGKIELVQIEVSTGNGDWIREFRATAFTSGFTQVGSSVFAITTGPMMFRLAVVGSNIVSSVSVDGVNWLQYNSTAKTTIFTTGPDEWGYYIGNASSATAIGSTLISWKES